MSSKSLIQSGIFLVILVILLVIYSIFFNKNEDLVKINEAEIDNKVDNKILDLKYNAIDEDGNSYVIESAAGKVSEKEKNLLILEKVTGVIKIKNSEDIIILSDFANYNKTTLDTYFYDNVRLSYDGHSINSDELFMNYIDKNINIKNNVRYKGLNNKLYADIVEIDLVTKFSKIYMLDKQKKVKVELKQNGSN
ncbi:LPS export ABC transporter periplasmic protein LptC [Candidatus Pelagibacter communis]|uniref:LPS export ABC transporter periplasmic protein LptC n=1 Tax=Pelagibacter ubique TaxID=198252 RepID=UPI00094D2B0E|nr:LPS export ABC transporter periplasmic protein LptC [Candidatus Pelagibacter ubique]